MHAEGEYVDLSVNPEVFTGYDGDSAHRVWRSIYDENCFGLSEQTQLATSSVTPTGVLGGPGLSVGRKSEDENSADGECLEKRVYYKIISGLDAVRGKSTTSNFRLQTGLHASISTHVCYENLDQKTGVWVRVTFSTGVNLALI
jgi:ERO1-like protein beta